MPSGQDAHNLSENNKERRVCLFCVHPRAPVLDFRLANTGAAGTTSSLEVSKATFGKQS